MTEPTGQQAREPAPDPKTRFDAMAGSLEERLYAQMTLIRAFEERLLALFEEGQLFGTTHCYIGQEADAVGVLNHLRAGDVVFSNHRCHGHFLTYADRPELLMAELMGKDGGLVGGRGGSQHICYADFYSNGVQGGIAPSSVGMALAEEMQGTGAIATVFLGDGTLGEGVVYEALNMASLWGAPILFVVEDNRWAQSTPVERELAGSMVARGAAFGIETSEITSTDATELHAHFAPIVERVRAERRPHFAVVHTYRLCHHSKSDDARPKDEVDAHREGDPLPLMRARLEGAVADQLDAEARARIDEAEAWARARPFPDPQTIEDALDVPPAVTADDRDDAATSRSGSGARVLRSLNESLHRMMARDERVLLMGEDLLDPYGGAFKVSKGLSTAHPDRVLTTPISEAGFTGVAAGMAMRGLRPVVEIMFGDFLMLAADQVLNHIAKFRWMYGEKVRVPLVIRAPMGGRRGYGPTHSQSIEKHFLGVPGLVVLAPHPLLDPGALLEHATLRDDRPVLFVENKLMYARPLRLPEGGRLGDLHARRHDGPDGHAPYGWLSLSYDRFEHADLTLVAYGGMVELALEAAEELLMEEEIYCEVVVPSCLNPLDVSPVAASLERTGRLLVAEESPRTAGFGAELIARVGESHHALLCTAPRRVAARETPIANTRALEEAILPQRADLVRAARELVAAPRPLRLVRG